MRELTFVGLSDDRLVLADSSGHRYVVPVDDRLAALVRRDRLRAAAGSPAGDEEMRPREVQARIRAGATAEEVAAAAGWPLERVQRYEGPVLAERSWVAEQARAVLLRRPDGSRPLAAVVTERLEGRGIGPDALRWDAWRREDGRWTLLLAFGGESGDEVATWVYDTAGRTVTPDDDTARDLVEEPRLQVEEIRPRLVGLPSAGSAGRHDTVPVGLPGGAAAGAAGGQATPGDLHHDVVQVVETTRTVHTVETTVREDVPAESPDRTDAGADEDVEVIETLAREPHRPPARPRHAKGRRASVPSWDEILFGAAKQDE